jgi:small subunit ribosomal protein S3
MGQKINPFGFRLGYIRNWKSRWFAKKDYAHLLSEDIEIRKLIKKRLYQAGVSSIDIERSGGKCRVKIYTARPGLVIGRRGAEIDSLRDAVSNLAKSEVALDIKEIKVPQCDAQLAAESIAGQLEKRVSFRRAMKKTIALAMAKGAQGVKVMCAGRLGGAEIARTERYHEGKIPLGTLRSDVDYGFATAFTTFGTIGCKVWIYKGDILVKKLAKEEREAREQELREAKAEAAAVAEKAKEKKENA